MIRAARSDVQNIAEGSMASATSTNAELKLMGTARASLEELLLDYEDFLRKTARKPIVIRRLMFQNILIPDIDLSLLLYCEGNSLHGLTLLTF